MATESCEQESNNLSSLFLSSEDRTSGFAIEIDEHHNIRLLRGSKRLAQFSRALNIETVKVLVKLIRDYDLRDERLASDSYTSWAR
ncbi:MAG: hypothetical protein PHF12_00035 [Candidatus Omnitrophica bacterium]|jgi:hypothetical protein|nr:hypothetical protein [Candidatus Omnitrophota bacterium]